MRRWTSLAAAILSLLFGLSCSDDRSNAVVPGVSANQSSIKNAQNRSQTHLWGYYDVCVDIPAKTATAVANRSAMFTANVVNFINGKPAGLAFNIKGTPAGADYVDVDIDITLTHPFPGLTQYNGYDVRGVFMGDGSASMAHNPDLIYPQFGADQFMFADPIDGVGGPDGYTRWFNCTEFSEGGMPLLQYTKGKVATPGYSPTATLCPYKYFADALSADEDLWTWFNDPGNPNSTGVFGAGQADTRNYYLRFPNSKGVKFGYAILANWKGTDPASHPANAPEAVAVSVVDQSDVYHISPTVKGGNLSFDVSLWDWDSTVNPAGVMEDYRIFVESTVLSNVYEASTSDMTPVGGEVHYSTYHIDIPADNVTGPDGNEYWVIAQCADEDYTNEFYIPNDAWDDPLAAFFRFGLSVSTEAVPPVAVAHAEPNPQSQCDGVSFDGKESYDPDGGTIQKYEWDWNNDGTYEEEGSEVYHVWEDPGVYNVQLRVTDDEGLTDLLDKPLEITIESASGWAETWGGSIEDRAFAVITDGPGNVYVAGHFQGTNVDFDPGSGTDSHSSNGGYDIYLSKFSSDGSFLWAKTWGGADTDTARALAVDGTGLYVGGYFSSTVDFDPGSGTASRTSNGALDLWLSRFDFDGDFQWVRTWGGPADDHLYCMLSDDSGNIYAGGAFSSASMDFDPGPGSDIHNNNGSWDCWLSKLSPDGLFQWARTWGGPGNEGNGSIALSGTGNICCIGSFEASADFDPGAGIDIHDSVGGRDAYISCISTSGSFQWARSWQGSALDAAYDVCTDSSGNIYVCGDFGYFLGGTIDIDPGPGTDVRNAVSWYDIWLCKLDPSGSFVWGRTWGGNYGEGAYGVDVDDSNSLYVAGYFRSDSVDFDPGPGTDIHYNVGMNAEPDICLSKFDSSGNFYWARTWGSAGQDYASKVMVRCPAAIYMAGIFYGTIDFDPGPGTDQHTSGGGEGSFVMKILADGYW